MGTPDAPVGLPVEPDPNPPLPATEDELAVLRRRLRAANLRQLLLGLAILAIVVYTVISYQTTQARRPYVDGKFNTIETQLAQLVCSIPPGRSDITDRLRKIEHCAKRYPHEALHEAPPPSGKKPLPTSTRKNTPTPTPARSQQAGQDVVPTPPPTSSRVQSTRTVSRAPHAPRTSTATRTVTASPSKVKPRPTPSTKAPTKTVTATPSASCLVNALGLCIGGQKLIGG